MVAMLATALAAVAETAYVGSFGTASLAGMALVFPLVMLQAMLSAGAMGGGVSSAVSRAFGAGEPERASALAVHAMWIGVGHRRGLHGGDARLRSAPSSPRSAGAARPWPRRWRTPTSPSSARCSCGW